MAMDSMDNFQFYSRRVLLSPCKLSFSSDSASFFYMTDKLAIVKGIISGDDYLLERIWYHYSNITRVALLFTLVTETNFAYNLFLLL
jgi:hypothetical protein